MPSWVLRLAAPLALLVLVCAPAAAHANGGGQPPQQQPLRQDAARTWASLAAMTDPYSALPADSLNADGSTSVQTSTTNIGAYMWSAVAAEKLGLIKQSEPVARLSNTVAKLE